MGPSPNAVFLSDIHQIASGVDATVAVSSALSSQIARLHTRQAPPSAVDWSRRAERQRFACVGMSRPRSTIERRAVVTCPYRFAGDCHSGRDSTDLRSARASMGVACRTASTREGVIVPRSHGVGGRTVQDGLALGLIPGVGWRAAEIRRVAREAEEAGFAAVFAAEVNNDVLATVQLMGEATQGIQVGSWVANIYLRHPYVCAQAAALIADATGGRMLLGLGVSHQPINSALDVGMGSPIGALRDYATAVASWLRGEGPTTHLPQRPSTHPVPIFFGALTSPTVELAGEMADGIMPVW